jgi:predicted metalloendopeptidase
MSHSSSPTPFDAFGRRYDETGNLADGQLMLSENIAAAAGMAIAFETWRAGLGGDALLPGLERFKREELFLLSFKRGWCGKFDRKVEVERLAWWSYASLSVRVLRATANSKAFQRLFSARAGSPRASCFRFLKI